MDTEHGAACFGIGCDQHDQCATYKASGDGSVGPDGVRIGFCVDSRGHRQIPIREIGIVRVFDPLSESEAAGMYPFGVGL